MCSPFFAIVWSYHKYIYYWHILDSETRNVFESVPLCSVTVQGVFPTLTVQDVRAAGSAKGYSKMLLWKLLSLERSVYPGLLN